MYCNLSCSHFRPDTIGMASWVIYYDQTLLNITPVLLKFICITFLSFLMLPPVIYYCL